MGDWNFGKGDSRLKIFGIMVVKNEADIVGETLMAAREWADKIFVLDNGSNDGTWEIVNRLADDVIVPVGQDFRPFRDDMRADVFDQFRHLAKPDDWWAFSLDADEFYIENPREFLSKIPRKYQVVAMKSLPYVITEEDVEEYKFTGNFSVDKEHIKYLRPKCWSEYRFFRHRDSIKWKRGSNLHQPRPIGVVSPETILVRHYQYRSPAQMQKRIDTRKAIQGKEEVGIFPHIRQNDWSEMLERRDSCIFDGGY